MFVKLADTDLVNDERRRAARRSRPRTAEEYEGEHCGKGCRETHCERPRSRNQGEEGSGGLAPRREDRASVFLATDRRRAEGDRRRRGRPATYGRRRRVNGCGQCSGEHDECRGCSQRGDWEDCRWCGNRDDPRDSRDQARDRETARGDEDLASDRAPPARPVAAVDELIAATGWLPHTARAALTGLRHRGYEVRLERGECRPASAAAPAAPTMARIPAG